MAEHRRAPAAALQRAGGRFLIVEARYYDEVGAMLFEGARAALEAAGASIETLSVPGALEIPAGIAIALGCVIRGETFHFEIVAGESARALMEMSVARKLALGNGILTVETLAQAERRADPKRGDKGGDAARAALALAALMRSLGAS